MTIAVYARNTKENLPVYVEKLAYLLQKEKVKLIIYEPYFKFLKEHFGFNIQLDTYQTSENLIAKADYVVCLGGDGTILETLDLIRKSGIPVLGVNTGRLGFLSSVAKEDFEKAITLLIKEKFSLDKRELLELVGGEMLFHNVNYALNEFTIHKKDTSAMIHIDTYVDGVFLNSYFADGLIIATPTGSTAYSLSCNGPIMVPDSENFVITPIAPHNLNVRPIVISNRKSISFKVYSRSEGYIIALDSRSATVNSFAELQVRRAKFKFNLVSFEDQHFFETLRNKLLWGIDKRPK